jgi:catechol 2,3-dioxygenase-like lactoylglutathione lyase family enzyme
MPRIRHLAFTCKEPIKIADFLHDVLGLEILYKNESGTSVLSDGETNITLNLDTFEYPWHFGLEMSAEEIAGRRSLLERMGAPTNDGVADGRPVEAFTTTPEGHRIDMAQFWPTQPGQRRREREAAPVDEDEIERLKSLPKIRHIAFCCQDPHRVADFLAEALDFDVLYHAGPEVVVLSDHNINLTLLPESFQEEDPVPWHFGLEMSKERIEALKPLLKEMGVELHEGVPDGRPVDQFIHTPEGHRIDLAPFWPTKPGQSRRPATADQESAAAG